MEQCIGSVERARRRKESSQPDQTRQPGARVLFELDREIGSAVLHVEENTTVAREDELLDSYNRWVGTISITRMPPASWCHTHPMPSYGRGWPPSSVGACKHARDESMIRKICVACVSSATHGLVWDDSPRRLLEISSHDDLAVSSRRRVDAQDARLARTANFSVGCYCEDETRCHRSLLRLLLETHGAKLA